VSSRERRLWHNPAPGTGSLGCQACPERLLCGGLRLGVPLYDCLQLCCGRPGKCDRVCRKNPDFARRVREIHGFSLCNVPRGPVLVPPSLPDFVPLLYHRTGLTRPVGTKAAAVPLYRLFDRKLGVSRFSTPQALADAFSLAPGTVVLASGTDRDPPLERWWNLGEQARREIIRAIRAAGVGIVTTPNYSLFVDRPRWDDLHAIKRIAETYGEFLAEGMPAALHVNGRTEVDFYRWAEFIASRPEVTHIAYEFTTGTGRAARCQQHALWLRTLASQVGRPLHLIVRGGTEVLPILAAAFTRITFIDTSAFMKTIHRQSAHRRGLRAIAWKATPTEPGTPLDGLFEDNTAVVAGWLTTLLQARAENAR